MFEQELRSIGVRRSAGVALSALSVSSFTASVLLFLLLPRSRLSIPLFFAIFLIPPTLFYFYLDYLRERKQKRIESLLPTALLHVSSFPPRSSMEKIISSLAESGYGELSSEFKLTEQQITRGLPVPKALENLRARNSSQLFRYAIGLLQNSYRSGVDLRDSFQRIANEVFELQSISRESAASFSLQKYTLLFGGGVIVPLVLGSLLNLVYGLALPQSQELNDAIIFGNQAYLFIYSLLSSVFVASNENNLKKSVLYFSFLAPTTFLLFYLVENAVFF